MRSTLWLILIASPAYAERQGLELGGGLDAGHLSCTSQTGKCNGLSAAFGGNLDASWFFTPQLGIAADAWVLTHSDSDVSVAHYINTVDVKWRPAPALTLQGGVGAAHATFSKSDGDRRTSNTAFAVMFGASYDVARGRNWTVSAEARFGEGFYTQADTKASNVGVGVGLTFFNF